MASSTDGLYQVRVSDEAGVLTGYVVTTYPVDQTSDNNNKRQPYGVTLPLGGVNLTADFGYTQPGAIGDFVWYDTNGDAIQDIADPQDPTLPGEKGIANVVMALYLDTNGNNVLNIGIDQQLATTPTDADGGYLFTGLRPGTYFVDVVPASNPDGPLSGLTHTVGAQSQHDPTGPIVLGAGEVYKDADFGYHEPVCGGDGGLIGDTVWYDDDGDGFQQTGELGIPNIQVCAADVNTASRYCATTDQLGRYGIKTPVGYYTVAPTNPPSGYTATTPTPHGPVVITDGQCYQDADFGYDDGGVNRLGEIGNLVFDDRNQDGRFDSDESPLPGVSVDLIRDSNNNSRWDAGEPIIATTTTGSSLDSNQGNYLFTGVPQGRYLVHVSDTNGVLIDFIKSPTPAPGTDNTNQNDPYPVYLVNPGDNNYTADFGFYKPDKPNSGVIGNQVWVEETDNGVFDEQAPGDVGQHGVTVDLLRNGQVIDTTTTGASGDYAFLHLPAGSYQVRVTDDLDVLQDYLPTTYPSDQSGDNTNKRQPYAVNLPTAGFNPTADFGYWNGGAPIQSATVIGNLVWEDKNGDGRYQPGEPGIPGVSVELWLDMDPANGCVVDAAEDIKVGAKSTALSIVLGGNYKFEGSRTEEAGKPPVYNGTYLPPGDYLVRVTDSGNKLNGYTQSVGPNPGQDGNSQYPQPYCIRGFNPTGRGDADLTADFGYWRPAAVGDFVWRDDNADGIEDIDEPGIGNVTVRLFRDANGNNQLDEGIDTVVGDKTTDADGGYLFTGLQPAVYFVKVTDVYQELVGLTHVVKNQSLPTPTGAIPLLSNDVYKDADFGYTRTLTDKALIGDTVWYDDNGDGVKQPGELGIPNIQVCATEVNSGQKYCTLTPTDDTGYYSIETPPGLYSVQPTNEPAGFNRTTPVPHPPVLLLAGEKYWDADFGYNDTPNLPRLCYIGNLVFNDVNKNGVFDAGDGALGGVSVTLIRDSNGNGQWDAGEPPLATVTSDTSLGANNGNYLFPGVPQGRYLVHVSDTNGVLLDWTKSPLGAQSADGANKADPYAVNLATPGSCELRADFGYYQSVITDAGVIGNQVWVEETDNGVFNANAVGDVGQHGVTVELLQNGQVIRTTTTGASGDYAFVHLPAGSYQVQVSDAFDVLNGYPPAIYPADQSGDNTNKRQPYTVSLPANGYNLTGDFGYVKGTPPQSATVIGNLVWEDMNGDGRYQSGEPGIPGVSVQLWYDMDPGNGCVVDAGEDILIDTKLTAAIIAAGGNYKFEHSNPGLSPGDYLVRVTDSGNKLNGYTQSVGPNLGQDGNSQYPQPYCIRNFNPTGTGDTNLTADFGYWRPAAVGDFVWRDDNADGIEDYGEPGIANVTVRLFRDANGNNQLDEGIDTLVGDRTTDADGGYLFDDLQPGVYFVKVTDLYLTLAGMTHIIQNQSLPTPTNPIPLLSNGVYKDADFGYTWTLTDKALIGDTVWWDYNGDGVKQPGELGIPNIDVCATDVDTNQSYCARTNATGVYSVEVPAGTYSVRPTNEPSGFTRTTPVPHPDTTVLAGDKYWDADFGYDGPQICFVGNLVFNDRNKNGVLDAGDGALGGVSVTLIRDANGNGQWDGGEPTVATVTSGTSLDANNGNYLFTGVPQGRYLVHVTDTNGVLLDWVKSPLGVQGADGTNKADPFPVNLSVPGACDLKADFGYYQDDVPDPGVIGNQVWLEYDGNGIFADGNGDVGQHGVTVELLKDNQVVMTTTTGPSGDYAFAHLPAGNYRVRVTDAFGVLSGRPDTTFPADQVSDNTNKMQPFGVGLPAASVNLTADFGYLCQSSVGGRVWHDRDRDGVQDVGEEGLRNIQILLLLHETRHAFVAVDFTDADGNFLFTDVAPGSYLVDVNQSYIATQLRYLTTPPEPRLVNVFECSKREADFGYASMPPLLGGIGNYVWYDVNDNFVQDEWLDKNNDGIANKWVDSNNDGLVNDPGYFEWVDLNRNNRVDEGEADKCGLSQVTVYLKDANGSLLDETETDMFGYYEFLGLPAARYRVSLNSADPELLEGREIMRRSGLCKPLPSGLLPILALSAQAADAGEEQVVEVKAAGVSAPVAGEADIRGQVRNDTDADGDLNDSDPGIPNVTLTLYADTNSNGQIDGGEAAVATTTTDSNGLYTFAQRAPGSYVVVEKDATGYGSSNDTAAPNDNRIPVNLLFATNSTGNNFLDTVVTCTINPDGEYIIDLPPGVFIDWADFATVCRTGSATVGDFIWWDVNRDGQQQTGEPGIPGVDIVLTGGSLTMTATTDARGIYTFADVASGYLHPEDSEQRVRCGRYPVPVVRQSTLRSPAGD